MPFLSVIEWVNIQTCSSLFFCQSYLLHSSWFLNQLSIIKNICWSLQSGCCKGVNITINIKKISCMCFMEVSLILIFIESGQRKSGTFKLNLFLSRVRVVLDLHLLKLIWAKSILYSAKILHVWYVRTFRSTQSIGPFSSHLKDGAFHARRKID